MRLHDKMLRQRLARAEHRIKDLEGRVEKLEGMAHPKVNLAAAIRHALQEREAEVLSAKG